MKTLLLFTALFAGCVSSKQQKLTNPTWQDGFIPNIELDTLNSIMLLTSGTFPIDTTSMPIGNDSLTWYKTGNLRQRLINKQ